MTYEIAIDGKSYRLDLSQAEGRWSCRVDGREVEVDAVLARPNVLSLRIGNKAYEVKCERVGGDVHIWVGSQRFAADVRDPRSLRGRARAVDDHGPKKLTAPMPGKVVRDSSESGSRSRSRGRRAGGRGDEDAERSEVAEEGNDSEDPGQRRHGGQCRGCAGDCRIIRATYFSIPLLSRTFFA